MNCAPQIQRNDEKAFEQLHVNTQRKAGALGSSATRKKVLDHLCVLVRT
jgi:hypothetical protein